MCLSLENTLSPVTTDVRCNGKPDVWGDHRLEAPSGCDVKTVYVMVLPRTIRFARRYGWSGCKGNVMELLLNLVRFVDDGDLCNVVVLSISWLSHVFEQMVWTLDRDINDIMGIVGFSPHPFLHVNIEMCKINSEGLSSLLHQCLIIRYKDHTIIHYHT